jgi:hypothetical protein
MAALSPKRLVDRLCRPAERYRTGVWLLSPEQFADAPDLAARLHCDAINAVDRWLQQLALTARYAGVEPASLRQFLYDICHEQGASSCAVLLHCDLLLSALPRQEQLETLNYFCDGIPYPKRAVMLVLPNTETLYSSLGSSLQAFEQIERLASGFDA